jgi:antitoxin ParD1/3/4
MDNSERFEIELPSDLAQFVHSQVGEGALTSEQDVVREAVRAMQRQAAKLGELRTMVNASIEDPRPSLTDEELRDRLERRAMELRSGRRENA